MNIAVIGYGSIGQRHEKNCLSLGHNVDVLSQHLNKRLVHDKYDLIIICSKTSEHLMDVKRFKNVSDNFLIEKPLAANYRDGMMIKKLLEGKKVRVGYCLIFNPLIAEVKQIIDKQSFSSNKKMLGDIYLAQIYAGSYLPGWRKGEDYRKRYSAKKDEGGGVELDLIHEINYAQYFFSNKITGVYAYQDKISGLEIDSNDIAFIAIRQKGRFISINLNYFQLFTERYIKLVGSRGTLFASLIDKEIALFNENNKKVFDKKFDFDYNQMYIDEIKSMEQFIKDNGPEMDILSLDQAILDLRIVGGKT